MVCANKNKKRKKNLSRRFSRILLDMDTPEAAKAREKLKALSGAELTEASVRFNVSPATLYRWRSGAVAPRFNDLAGRISQWCDRRAKP